MLELSSHKEKGCESTKYYCCQKIKPELTSLSRVLNLKTADVLTHTVQIQLSILFHNRTKHIYIDI